MGIIKEEVLCNQNLTKKDISIVRQFTDGFDINYGDLVNAANTKITVFIIKPEEYIKEGFGIEKECMLIFSHYTEMEARAIRAAEELIVKYPFKNRVDNLCFFLVSDDEKVEDWVKSYYDPSNNSRIIFPFSLKELEENKGNSWYIREKLRQYSFDKDLFGYTLPLRDDSSFFGRQQILGRYIDSIKRCQNRGIFGLRKTGKTSLLFKINRTIVEQKIGQVFFFDCKNPQVRKKRWFELLNDINLSISGRIGIKNFECSKEPLKSISSFQYLMKKASDKGVKIILIFDEIEYISYYAKIDKHWEQDYFEFWQTLWSEQSTFANLCFIICGVNAYVTEKDSINGVQNPLFGIIQSEYLKGLSMEETNTMIKTLGKRMGLKFDYDAIQFLYEQYGGHPMLTRLACSWLNRYLLDEVRPLALTKDKVKSFQNDIDEDPAFFSYFGHVVSEIKQFYPDEYEMMEILASGQVSDFMELSEANEFIQHLNSYGLISKNNNIPYISLPVAGRYIALELAKREGRKTIYKLIDKEKRESWIRYRIKVIIETIRNLESSIRLSKKPELFGVNSFSDAEKLKEIPVAEDENSFIVFINTFYKCFVESINNYGKSIGNNKYIDLIEKNYGVLYRTLDKIKEYRNERDHILLKDYHKQKLDMFLSEDLEPLDSKSDKYFCIQQKIIIELITSIHSESINLG